MAVNPIIAQGVQPIDVSNTLYRIATMKRADEELARRNRYNDLLERRYDDAQKKAADTEERKQALAKVEWALQSPSPAAAILDDPEAVMAFTQQGVDLVGLDDARAKAMLEQARAQMSSELGVGPPEPKDPGPLVEAVRDGQPVLLPRDQAVGLRPYDRPQQYAPVRPQWQKHVDENGYVWTYDANATDPTTTLKPVMTPGGRHLRSQPTSSGGPRIVNDPIDGPMMLEQGEGGYVRRPIPVAGGGAPSAAPAAQNVQEGQTGMSKSGRPIVFRNGRWEYQ